MTEKLVMLSDVEYYLRQTAKNILDDAEKDAETLSDGERGQICACVLALRELANNVHRLPDVDAAPVVHGQWVYGEDVDIQCSECGRDAMSDWMKYTQVYSPYCPWCGAKMDAKEGEQDEG